MYYLVMVLHLVISLVLCVVVLLQSSKGDGLAGAFGGGASQAVFGARGVTTLLHKLTIYLAVAFMVTSLVLVLITMNRTTGSSLSQRAAERVPVGNAAAVPTGDPTAVPTGGAVIPTTSVDGTTTGDAQLPPPPEGTDEGEPQDVPPQGGDQ